MSATSQCTYIIGFRNSGDDRKKNLDIVLSWLNKYFPRITQMVIEDKSDSPFNRAELFNRGASRCHSQYIVFGDADIVMNPDDFYAAIMKITEFDSVNPFKTNITDISDIDLDNWTYKTMPNNSIIDICYSKYLGLFVAVSAVGTYRTTISPDGIHWIQRALATTGAPPEVNSFVASSTVPIIF